MTEPAAEVQDVRRQVVHGLRWLAGARTAGQLLSWLSTVVVIRLLTPADYGVMAMAMALIGLLNLINDMGLGSALVQQRELDRAVVRQVLGLAVLVNASLCAGLFIAAPWVAEFYAEPVLEAVVRVLALQFVLGSLGGIQSAVLGWRMDFRARSLADLARICTSSLLTLALAASGAGVWALVWGQLGGLTVWSLVNAAYARYWCWPDFMLSRRHGHVFAFGGYLTLERVLWYLYSQADVVIVGKLLGNVALGYYSVAMQLATLPMQKLCGMLNEVSFSAYSRVQDDARRYSHYCLKALRLIAIVGYPMFFGIAAVADELVAVLLGSGWSMAAEAIRLLALVMPLRMLASAVAPALQGIGRSDLSARNQVVFCVVMPIAFLIGCHWGLKGVVLAWVVAYPLTLMGLMYRTLPVIGLTLAEAAVVTVRPAIAAALAWGALVPLHFFFGYVGIHAPLPILAISLLIGALVYGCGLYLIDRRALSELRVALR